MPGIPENFKIEGAQYYKMEKISKRYAMIHAKCPRCRKGDMFTAGAYSLKMQKMYKSCLHCGLHFE
jgi:uncharacterized protein (DUF983 family)